MSVEISLGMTEYYIPHCELKPTLEQSFKTLDEGVKFYRIYAESSGFHIRLGSEKKSKDGTIIWKYVYCSREGEKNALVEVGDSSDVVKIKKRRVSKRSNCRDRIVFMFCSQKGYIVKLFEERHSHPLVSDDFKRFLKVNRNLDDVHKNFILNCARANISPMRCYRLFKEGVGSYSDVDCTGADFKNYARDLRAYIHGVDAQMVIALSRRNYAAFGDVVSFDSTYSLNMYNMIFAPFTGKDNHGKCVCFGASLLSDEDNESYSWVFEKFLKCMGNSPGMIITDQDPEMKVAIEQSFPDSRHRLCMWHIMIKVPEKAPRMLSKDDSFMKRLSDAVWELPMSGLCRTTLISESSNSLFNRYINFRSNLVEFFMHFDIAIDAQRHAYDLKESLDESTVPITKTLLEIEKHAASIYTSEMFKKVQEEIVASCFKCSVAGINHCDSGLLYDVDDGSKITHTVTYNKEDDIVKLKALFQCGDMDGSTSTPCKMMMFEQFYGSRAPSEIHVHPPILVKTKGSGSRLISKKEARKRNENKPLRMCSNCHKLSDHDARNCPA
ncbi:hypothetical protein C2S53_018995 [Perilla frutescens var. hirtella]|uniref:Protein FAR1-RELATED SEQUENCE n=1 Tax=Perilla frutescens var. hirtella TaxID=608512 RepID=A0AAD4P957_PERFH|nr:hypothetical protein C2S53_018995 [Perilla frutescens var. hirtella]